MAMGKGRNSNRLTYRQLINGIHKDLKEGKENNQKKRGLKHGIRKASNNQKSNAR